MSVKRFIRWFIVCTVGISLVVLFTIGPAKSASANVKESLSNSIVKKALVSGVRRCYSSGALSPKVEKLSSFTSFGDLITGGNAEDYIALPNGLTNVTDSNVSCKQLFMGYSVGGGSFDGLFKLASRKADGLVTVPEKTALLEGMGYEVNNSGGSSSKKCVNFVYSYTALGVSGETATKSICIDGSNNITVEASQSTNCGGTDSTLACQVPITFEIRGKTLTMHDHDFMSEGGPITYNGNWDEFIGQVERQLSTNLSNVDDGTVFYSFKRSNPISDGGQGDTSYILKSDGVNNALQYLSLGLSSQFSNSEKLSYYVSAIKNWFFDGVNIEGGTSTNSYWTCGITDWNAYGSYTDINSNMNGTSGCNCGIDISKASKTADIYGFSDDSFDASGGTTLSLANTVTAIDSLVEAAPPDSCEPSEDDENPEETPSGVTDTDGTTSEDNCYGSPGTLGLSWILCPILSGMSNTLNKTYEDIVKNYLEVEPEFVSTGGATYQAWQVFQNIANIILVIFLLVVIFSQLTGIGIDNYGIKKILPRLIICAVLINLSYFIIQFFVDVSNIVGNSVNGIFSSLPNGSINMSEIGSSTSLSIPSHVLGLSLTAGATAGVIAVVMNPAILLSFLLVLISGLISVLAMWLILMARKAGVVIVVIIAPIAFALYLLPNTSKITKSWANLLKSLLLVYPLAALLISASYYVSDLIAGGNNPNPDMILPAMLLRVVPFLALPSLFRKSIDAVGNLGTKIQGFGRTLGRGATGAIRDSDTYKTLQKAGLERGNRIRAGLDTEGNLTDRGERMARRNNRGIRRMLGMNKLQASRIARANKAREEEISSTAELGEVTERRELARNQNLNRQDYLERQLTHALETGNTKDYYAAVDQATKSGMKSSDIAKITRMVFKNASRGGNLADDGQWGNFLQEFANRYGGSFLKKDAEQKSWAATRAGKDTNIGSHALSGFAAAGGMEVADLKDNEVVDLSADRLHELLAAGIIDAAQAQRVWSSGANMDSINKLMLGAMGTRGTLINKTDAQKMTSGTYTGGMHGLDRKAVQALTEATPQDTVIRDVRWKNANGIEQQTNPLVTAQSTQTSRDVTFTKDLGNGGRQTKTFQLQPDGRYLDPTSGRTFTQETLRNGGWTNTTP